MCLHQFVCQFSLTEALFVCWLCSVCQDSSGSGVERLQLHIPSHSGHARLVQSGHLCALPEGSTAGVRLAAVPLSRHRLSGDLNASVSSLCPVLYLLLYLSISGVCVFSLLGWLFTVWHHVGSRRLFFTKQTVFTSCRVSFKVLHYEQIK